MLDFHKSNTGWIESVEFQELIDAAEALEKPISAPVLVGCLEFVINLLKKVNNEQKTHELPRQFIERRLGTWQADADPRVLIDLYLKHGQLYPAEDLNGKEVLRNRDVDDAEKAKVKKSAQGTSAARSRWDQENSTLANAKVQNSALPNGKGEKSGFANAKAEKPPQTSPAKRSLHEIMHALDHLHGDE